MADHGFGEKHFAIFYDRASNNFQVVDLFQGTGTFVLLSKPLALESNQVVSFGSSHITFDKFENGQLQIRCISGPLKGQSFLFSPEQQKVKIGRHSNAEVRINENGLSRVQCIIMCDGSNWNLKDGDESKLSTNGTWLYLNDPYVLEDETVFKAGKTIFRTKLSLWKDT